MTPAWRRPGPEPSGADPAGSDFDTFLRAYQRYAPLIYRFAYSRLRQREAAEDVTSDVFYKALRACRQQRPPPQLSGSFLYRIAINTVIDRMRGHRRTSSLDEMADRPDPVQGVEERVVRRDELTRVWSALDRLKNDQRVAVTMKLGLDLHTADIAKAMGRSEGAVKLLIHRGLAAVRRQLEAEREGDAR